MNEIVTKRTEFPIGDRARGNRIAVTRSRAARRTRAECSAYKYTSKGGDTDGDLNHARTERSDGMIPFVDLKAQYAVDQGRDRRRRARGAGEHAVRARPGRRRRSRRSSPSTPTSEQAIGVNTGTSALHLALLAAGVGRGDEVITTPFTFIATVSAIDYCGATPVFVDIDPATFTIDPALIEAAITPRTKAILPVHLYGQLGRHGPDHGDRRAARPVVIEDAAQAHGAEYRGPPRRQHRRARLLQLLSRQEPRRLRRGRRRHHRRRRVRRAPSRCSATGARSRSYHHELKGFNCRLEGVQGASWGQAGLHRGAGPRRAARTPPRYDERLGRARLSHRRRARRSSPRLPRLRDPHARRDELQAFLNDAASRPASTTRSRSTCSRRSPTSATAGATSRSPRRPPTRCCRCRCSRR